MTQSEFLRVFVVQACNLAKIHPAGGVLAVHLGRLLHESNLIPARAKSVQTLREVVACIRRADHHAYDDGDIPMAMNSLGAAQFALGACIGLQKHAAWGILYRAVRERCKLWTSLKNKEMPNG